MMARTHILTSVAFSVTLIPAFMRGNYSTEQYALLCGGLVIGSLLPDIDHPHSLISQTIPLVGGMISRVTKHRGLFHSILGVVLIFFATAFGCGQISRLLVSPLPYTFGAGVVIGYVIHIAGDLLTVSGVRLLYPVDLKIAIPLMRTGDYREWIFRVGVMVFIGFKIFSFFVSG